MASDNKPSDQDGGASDTENYALAFVSVLIRFYGCPVASKTSSTEYEDAGHFDPKLRGRHRLNKNVDATHFNIPESGQQLPQAPLPSALGGDTIT
ncbi:MAG: hypothetical protein WAM50_18910, partial [Pseudolabrys sp.]